jgi:lipid A 3-O-deacylase
MTRSPSKANSAAVVAAAAVVLVAALRASSAVAGEVTLTFDNDFFAGVDRHYTNGMQVAVVAQTSSLPALARALLPFGASIDPQYMFAIGQRIYTPTDTTAMVPDARDRPYAGWLYALAEFRVRRTGAVDHFTASLGVVGPAALARQTQNAIHRALREDDSHGWEKQLRNEPGLLLGYERAWLGLARTASGPYQMDLTPRAGVTVGNFLTYASAGAIARIGYNLPDDFPATHISLGPPRDGYRGNSTRGWYVWIGVDARLVGRNIFLDGNSFRDSASVERRRFVWDLQGGVAATWGRERIAFALVRRSEEFTTQAGADRFGQLTYSFSY